MDGCTAAASVRARAPVVPDLAGVGLRRNLNVRPSICQRGRGSGSAAVLDSAERAVFGLARKYSYVSLETILVILEVWKLLKHSTNQSALALGRVERRRRRHRQLLQHACISSGTIALGGPPCRFVVPLRGKLHFIGFTKRANG